MPRVASNEKRRGKSPKGLLYFIYLRLSKKALDIPAIHLHRSVYIDRQRYTTLLAAVAVIPRTFVVCHLSTVHDHR